MALNLSETLHNAVDGPGLGAVVGEDPADFDLPALSARIRHRRRVHAATRSATSVAAAGAVALVGVYGGAVVGGGNGKAETAAPAALTPGQQGLCGRDVSAMPASDDAWLAPAGTDGTAPAAAAGSSTSGSGGATSGGATSDSSGSGGAGSDSSAGDPSDLGTLVGRTLTVTLVRRMVPAGTAPDGTVTFSMPGDTTSSPLPDATPAPTPAGDTAVPATPPADADELSVNTGQVTGTVVLTQDGTVVLTRNGTVVAVGATQEPDFAADALTFSNEGDLSAQVSSAVTSRLVACPGTGGATADETTVPSGSYAVQYLVPTSSGTITRAATGPWTLTLLDEPAAVALPAGYPSDEVPVVAGTLLAASRSGDSLSGWTVQVAVAGDDGLARAAAALQGAGGINVYPSALSGTVTSVTMGNSATDGQASATVQPTPSATDVVVQLSPAPSPTASGTLESQLVDLQRQLTDLQHQLATLQSQYNQAVAAEQQARSDLAVATGSQQVSAERALTDATSQVAALAAQMATAQAEIAQQQAEIAQQQATADIATQLQVIIAQQQADDAQQQTDAAQAEADTAQAVGQAQADAQAQAQSSITATTRSWSVEVTQSRRNGQTVLEYTLTSR